MFLQNKIDAQQRGNKGFCVPLICVLISLVFIGFCANFAGAAPVKAVYKYQEIKAISKNLKKQKKQEDLEKLVEKSEEFVAAHPKYKRIDEVYHLLGNALVALERVEEGIKTFEVVIKDYPKARYVERCLLDLGLAYDKLGDHNAADDAYQKLIDHPKYGSRSQAKLAKKILEQDKADRNGELPRPPGVRAGPSSWVGKPALDFQVTDLKGEEFSLEKYRGQVVLLDFWATWCGPCIVEMPNVKKTYAKYKDQKFQIIGISLDRSIEPLEAYIEKEGLEWLHYWDKSNKISGMYKVQAIPSTFLIDGEGIIRKTNLRGHALEHAVEELVKENLARPAGASTKTLKTSSQSQSIPATKIIKQNKTPQKTEASNPFKPSRRNWVGKPAPNFQVTDLKGEEISLEKYRGQIVLLDFWATWCGPCIAEMPKVKRIYNKYKDQNFQIIGISLDRSVAPLEAYIEKEGLAWLQYWDESRKVRNLYEVRAIPSTFLIDGEGIIRKASIGGFNLETAVSELVKENLVKPVNPSTPVKTPPDSETDDQTENLKAKEIIDAAVAAHGGLEQLELVKNIVMESNSFEHLPDGTMQDEGQAKTYFDANRIRSDWGLYNQKNSHLIFNGESVSMVAEGEVKPVSLEDTKSYVTFFNDSLFREPIWLLAALSKGDIPVQYIGTEKVKGNPTSVLLVTQPSGKKLKIFISEETHHVVQFSYDVEIGDGVENVTAFFDDYRDVDGIQIPYYRSTKNGEYRRVFITNVTLNTEIDEALFHLEQ